jgi:hypothetical protein
MSSWCYKCIPLSCFFSAKVWPESWKGKTFPAVCGEVADSVLGCTWHSSFPGPSGSSEWMLTLDRTGATGGSSMDKSHTWVQVSSLLEVNGLCFAQTHVLISWLSVEIKGFLVVWCCSVRVRSVTYLEVSVTELQLYFKLEGARQGEAVRYNLLSCGV